MMKRLVAVVLLLVLLCGACMAEREIDPQKPMIALTFDDGPTEHTEKIMQVLEKYGARATFFVVGNRISGYEQTLCDMLAAGHEIGNHTWDHSGLRLIPISKVQRVIERCNEKIEAITGVRPRYLRPPYGLMNREVYFEIKALEMITVIWSLDTMDWDVRNADKIYKTVMKNVRDGDIVLFHDTVSQNIEVLERILPELAEKGYQFVTVGEMFDCAREAPKYITKYSEMPPEKRKTGNVQN